MSKIEQRLNTLFQEYRIIIWYDEGGSLKDEFNSLEIEASKIELSNNEFGIKVKVLFEDRETKFLIYSANGEPDINENWLLDIEQSFHKFSADPISMIVSDLELDVSKKAFIAEHKTFFNAKSRYDKYKSIISLQDSDDELTFKMISVVLGCDETIESILLTLIEKEILIDEVNKYNLSVKLFKSIAKKFKYNSTTPTINDLIYKLLQNHFYATLDMSKCELNKEAKLFVKQWMDSNRHKELFSHISQKVQQELNITNILSSYKFENLLDCDTYEVCEQYIISNLRELIISQKINQKELESFIAKREHKFWYEKYENIYKTFKYAIKLSFGINSFKADINDFEDGVKKYINVWWEIDYNYRKFIYYFGKSEHKEIVKALDILEDAYLNSYLRVLNDKWQNYVKDYSIGVLNHQRRFYNTNIPQIVQKGQKAFVIISDAMRYECAKEFAKIIVYENTQSRSFAVKESYMISSLPSFTQLGMASLLPNKNIKLSGDDSGTVIVDDINTRSGNRDKVLKSYVPHSMTISAKEFLAMTKTQDYGTREVVRDNDVVYIYHNIIDHEGKQETEDTVFRAAEECLNELKQIVRKLTSANATNIIVTADHGFLYQFKSLQESDFAQNSASGEEVLYLDRRFVIGKNLEDHQSFKKFSEKELGLYGELEVLIPKSINRLRKKRSSSKFVHGGSTLQEIVVPVVHSFQSFDDNFKISCV